MQIDPHSLAFWYIGPMKRIMISFGMLVLLVGNVFGDESGKLQRGLSVGASWNAQKERYGGKLEVGLPIVDGESGWLLRSSFGLGGYGGSPSQTAAHCGGLALDAKIIGGGKIQRADYAVRSYGYLSGEFGMFATDTKFIHAAPFMVGIGMGGGFEFQFARRVAFFIECGGALNLITGNEAKSFSALKGGGPALSIGWRNYF